MCRARHAHRVYNNSETIYYKLANRLEATFNVFLAAHVIPMAPAEQAPAGMPTPAAS